MPLFLAKGISEMSSLSHFLISPIWGWLVVRWDLLSGQKCSDCHFPHLLPKGRLLGHSSCHCTLQDAEGRCGSLLTLGV